MSIPVPRSSAVPISMPWRRSPRKASANFSVPGLLPPTLRQQARFFGFDMMAAAQDGPAIESKTVTDPLLQLNGIKLSFGRLNVLKGVSFDIFPGEIVALVGDNGAGKSSLIKVITGVHKPSAGEISFKGQKITLH